MTEAATAVQDPEAPYGRRRDGQPKAKPGVKPKAPPPRRARSGAPRRKPAAAPVDYAKEVRGWFGLAQFGALMAYGRTQNEVFVADFMAIGMYADDLSAEAATIIEEDERLAGLVDRFVELGPYAKLAGIFGAFVAQLATNRSIAPVGVLGSVDPNGLVRVYKQQKAEAELIELRERQEYERIQAELEAEIAASHAA